VRRYLLECDSSLASGLEQRQAHPFDQAFSEKKSKVQLLTQTALALVITAKVPAKRRYSAAARSGYAPDVYFGCQVVPRKNRFIMYLSFELGALNLVLWTSCRGLESEALPCQPRTR
jgi:hypothetical protein